MRVRSASLRNVLETNTCAEALRGVSIFAGDAHGECYDFRRKCFIINARAATGSAFCILPLAFVWNVKELGSLSLGFIAGQTT